MRKVIGLALTGLMLAVFSCGGGGQQPAPAPKMEQLPDWVLKGSGAFGGEAGKVFYGVGTASGSKNVAMLRDMADNRARSKIAQIFKNYSAVLMKDYMATASSGEQTTDEQYVEQAIKTFSAATLSGVQVVDRHRDSQGTWYSLARLDLSAFTDALEKMNELDKKVKEHIRKNAERVHMDLEKEEAKHAGK